MATYLERATRSGRADRVAAFEEFLVKVQQAVEAQRPDLEGRWRVLKATEAGDVTTYAFIFEGGDLEADWDLRTLMPAHYGAEARLIAC